MPSDGQVTKKPTHVVHAYPLVRVQLSPTTAECQQDALAAINDADFVQLFSKLHPIPGVDSIEFADEIIYAKVDDVDDLEFERSRNYHWDQADNVLLGAGPSSSEKSYALILGASCTGDIGCMLKRVTLQDIVKLRWWIDKWRETKVLDPGLAFIERWDSAAVFLPMMPDCFAGAKDLITGKLYKEAEPNQDFSLFVWETSLNDLQTEGDTQRVVISENSIWWEADWDHSPETKISTTNVGDHMLRDLIVTMATYEAEAYNG